MSVELPFWENEKGRRKVGDLRDKDEDEDEDMNEDKNDTDGLMHSFRNISRIVKDHQLKFPAIQCHVHQSLVTF